MVMNQWILSHSFNFFFLFVSTHAAAFPFVCLPISLHVLSASTPMPRFPELNYFSDDSAHIGFFSDASSSSFCCCLTALLRNKWTSLVMCANKAPAVK